MSKDSVEWSGMKRLARTAVEMSRGWVWSLASRYLVQPWSLRRELARYSAFSYRDLVELEMQIWGSKEWQSLKKHVETMLVEGRRGESQDATKYLNIKAWLRVNILRGVRLGLHQSPPITILDLGTGTALFPFVCRFWHHTAIGLDQPVEDLSVIERPIYTSFPDILGIEMIHARIDRYRPVDYLPEYDLVTTFMVCFNGHKKPDEWGLGEWKFFVGDLGSHVQNGRLIFLLNAHPERYGDLRFFDRSTRDYFLSVGTVAADGWVEIQCKGIAGTQVR